MTVQREGEEGTVQIKEIRADSAVGADSELEEEHYSLV